ncbi:cell cycle checkpoint protein rad17-like [Stylonychia lemnae]|uniref:Cell cycle checkpoint protein rad17-like n=1 Tax=Stylonychia lemnae TaxID=5949 RepID=A0A078AZT8_STYLE|nr:cell cycle checkpoint protein rad17-like [Stylonychia lemnae]|eukprot:CDW87611.1 cell cycle checkpoint protein rad17-like [Stylonychia lemnae]
MKGNQNSASSKPGVFAGSSFIRRPTQATSKQREDDNEDYNNATDKQRQNQNTYNSQNDMMDVSDSSANRRQRSRNQQSNLSSSSGNANQINKQNTKKRKLQEIYEDNREDEITTIGESEELWTQKYIPTSLDELIIQKAKISEFERLLNEQTLKLIIFTGPTGSGKNTLINTYCNQNDIQLIRYKFQNESRYYDLEIDSGIRNFGQTYPSDLESLIYFIRTNVMVSSSNASAGLKRSRFASTKTTSTLGGDQPVHKPDDECQFQLSYRMNQEYGTSPIHQRKILVINGIPECLTMFTPRRFEFIRDFNQAVQNVVFSQNRTPLIIFTLSEQQERSMSFIVKIFGKEIVQQKDKAVAFFNLNPPTEKGMDKLLKNIAFSENLNQVNERLISEIRDQSNRDLRNAITTLQFKAAGKRKSEFMDRSKNSKQPKSNNRRNKVITEEDMQEEEKAVMSQKTTSAKEQKESFAKDNPYSIFHGLGKFLYNKRINPETQKIEQLSPSKMMRKNKPKLYFSHKDILNQIQLEPNSFCLYLHQNMLEFFNSVEDIANALDIFSLTDNLETRVPFNYDTHAQIKEFEEQNAILKSMSITECNLHVGGPKNSHLYQMQKPQFYDFTKNLRENRYQIRSMSKDQQILNNKLVSEDLLLRSQKEIVRNILPYMKQMNHPAINDVKEIATFSIYGHSGNSWNKNGNYDRSNLVGEDEARDNFFKEQEIEERLQNINKSKKTVGYGSTQSTTNVGNTVMLIEANSCYKAMTNNPKSAPQDFDDINDSELDLLLEDLELEEEISDSDNDMN